ncbi:carbohydrate ABC transporter permease [Ruminococcaceae bacterium OttesenSCG-928-A11]|nr:carbohydrate ABC transporter permease [Ruminococcaceae bacterium OttesenSCG-928-A11]
MIRRKKLGAAATVVLGIVAALVTLYPFLWALSTSLKTDAALFTFPPKLIPDTFVWENYLEGWNLLPFPRLFFNSFAVSLPVTLITVLICAMAAFAFVRVPFPFRNAVFLLYLSTLMVPQIIRLIPSFITVRNIGLTNSYLGMILPQVAWAVPFGTFLIRQFLLGLPIELDESAKIDGAGSLRIFAQIVMPNAKGAMLTLGTYTFLTSWNNLIWMMVITNKESMNTVTLGLATMTGPSVNFVPPWNLVMAATVISIIPILLIFIFFQKYFIQSVALSGVKG